MAAQPYRSAPTARPRSPRPSGLPALDHVQVAAPPGCESAARAFYGGLLGLPELDKPAPLRDRGGAWFALAGGCQLHVGVAGAGFVSATKAHPALRVGDGAALQALADRLAAAGRAVDWGEALAGGRRRFYTVDPWGNRLELLA